MRVLAGHRQVVVAVFVGCAAMIVRVRLAMSVLVIMCATVPGFMCMPVLMRIVVDMRVARAVGVHVLMLVFVGIRMRMPVSMDISFTVRMRMLMLRIVFAH